MDMLINIDVPDIEAALRFYQTAVDLKFKRFLFGGTVAEMEGASSSLYLTFKKAGSYPSPETIQRREYHRHWTPVHLDFIVDDIEKAVSRACGAGAVLEGEIACFGWGRLATMSDPFGNGFCLLQWQGQGYEADAATTAPDA
ncbi:MAG TPA: VOC family protein [Burkholderiales bacterium]|nr:VOC family protein [Burkholderiales bacterium]